MTIQDTSKNPDHPPRALHAQLQPVPLAVDSVDPRGRFAVGLLQDERESATGLLTVGQRLEDAGHVLTGALMLRY